MRIPIRQDTDVGVESRALTAKFSHLPPMSDTIDEIAQTVFDRLPEVSELDTDDLIGIVCRVWNEEHGVTNRHPDLFVLPDDLLDMADVMRAMEITNTVLATHGRDDPRIIERFFFAPDPAHDETSLYIAWSKPEEELSAP